MTERDELAWRVAERLGVKIVSEQWWSGGRCWIPEQIRDALLSAERRCAELEAELRDIRQAWVIFYGALPDGEYEGLGGMRAALDKEG